jgi:hypothetical protein
MWPRVPDHGCNILLLTFSRLQDEVTMFAAKKKIALYSSGYIEVFIEYQKNTMVTKYCSSKIYSIIYWKCIPVKVLDMCLYVTVSQVYTHSFHPGKE